MFKIIFLLFALYAALIHARPGFLHESSALLPASYETVAYAPTVVGHSYETVPTAVSHQSSTVVHQKRPYYRPIVAHAPVLKSYVPTVTYEAAPALSYSAAPWGIGGSHVGYGGSHVGYGGSHVSYGGTHYGGLSYDGGLYDSSYSPSIYWK